MAHQMSIMLSDAEYVALTQEAAKNGKPIESLLHEMLTQHLQPATIVNGPITSRKLQEYLYREGIIDHFPSNEPIKPEEQVEREYLARLFGQGQPVSEMVIEDRGPR